jgi:hypothetical protein
MDRRLKERLNESVVFAQKFDVQNVVARYELPADIVKEACKKYGLLVSERAAGTECVWLYKPNVLNHPVTHQPALTGNLGAELKDLRSELERLLSEDYTKWVWMLHRFVWRNPDLFASISRARQIAFSVLKGKRRKLRTKLQAPKVQINEGLLKRMGNAFTEEDQKNTAESIKRHLHPVKWKKGDVLIIDNLRSAHLGMPGFGPRVLRVILCNPVKMEISPGSSGRQTPTDSDRNVSLAEHLRAQLQQARSGAVQQSAFGPVTS